MVESLAKAQSTQRNNIRNFAFLCVSARKNEKRKNINNVDKVCCLLTVVR